MAQNNVLLQVRELVKTFSRTKGFAKRVVSTVKAVDRVGFEIHEEETFALVGESGCGKTTTGRCILRAIEPDSGEVCFRLPSGPQDMVDILRLDKKALREIRQHVALIFQDPYSSLNPRMNIFDTISEPLVINKIMTNRHELEDRVADLLRKVGLDPGYMRRYPHAFSGGQRQRIAIARELAMSPKFIIADEPVSALDVSVQAQVLNLLNDLQAEFGLTYLFIAHDLAAVEYISHRIGVMYVGRMVELAQTKELLGNPKHPYTEALLAAVPKADPRQKTLEDIYLEGEVPDPANPPSGCYFHPRCRYAQSVCRQETPTFVNVSADKTQPHLCACHFADTLTLKGVRKN